MMRAFRALPANRQRAVSRRVLAAAPSPAAAPRPRRGQGQNAADNRPGPGRTLPSISGGRGGCIPTPACRSRPPGGTQSRGGCRGPSRCSARATIAREGPASPIPP